MYQGAAIPAADRERIFEPYHRGGGGCERARRRPRPRPDYLPHIVERHGGQIVVSTADDGDNRFTFTLPA